MLASTMVVAGERSENELLGECRWISDYAEKAMWHRQSGNSLEEALQEAQSRNPGLEKALSDITTFAYTYPVYRGEFLPQQTIRDFGEHLYFGCVRSITR